MLFQAKPPKSLKITVIVVAVIVIVGVLALVFLTANPTTNTTLSSATTTAATFSDNLKGWTQYMADPQKQGGNLAGLDKDHIATTLKVKWSFSTPISATLPAREQQLEKVWATQPAIERIKLPNSNPSGSTVTREMVFEGSWNGYFYAFDANSGALIWSRWLGQTRWKKYGPYSYPTEPDCSPSLAGINSSAAISSIPVITTTNTTTTGGIATEQNQQVVFVGGGNNLFYALKAATGEVLWTFNMTTAKPNDYWSLLFL
jgi:outer membrane protein assembly factor BamB